MLGSDRCAEFDEANVELLGAVTGLGVLAIRRRIARAHGNSLIRTVFAEEWPTEPEALARLTVATARWAELGDEIAHVTGLGIRAVKNRLEREHGKMLVGNAFPELATSKGGVPTAQRATRAAPAREEAPPSPRSKPAEPKRSAASVAAAGRSVQPRSPSPRPREGDVVDGRYRLGAHLGGGGFGTAYEAESLAPPHQKVVIKFANPGDPKAAKLLEDEFAHAFPLKHQNIIGYLDRRVDPALGAHLVLHHGGQSVSKLFERDGRRGLEFALQVIEQVAAGLDHAHSRGVLHQDVKPANIMIEESLDHLDVRIGDFGIAKRGKAGLNTEGAHTVLGTEPIASTYPYASPEQLEGRPARRAADQFSLARVFCALLEWRDLRVNYQVPRFSQLSVEQDAALRKALSDEPKARFGRCCDFAAALRSGGARGGNNVDVWVDDQGGAHIV